ncbi:hypothetical protein DFP94_105207 [Fontibacillus phaseoli]|uniref:Uncharacterized protein n=1 Tax=Fontibacillus phaseoli TaxID=1416533 RepID=A0A369BCC7_9BACL|nr:hypothetical protein DFP94_105207 [Fontibacillus phaseoli]
MLLKKYFVVFLFLLLSLGYSILTDVLVGQPWDTVLKNFNYAMVTTTQKITVCGLALSLVVPDLYHAFKTKKEKKSAHNSGSGSDSDSDSDSGYGSGSSSGTDANSNASSDPAPGPSSGSYGQSRPTAGTRE